MIEYMYTGSFEAAETHAEELLAIADKYAVLALKVNACTCNWKETRY